MQNTDLPLHVLLALTIVVIAGRLIGGLSAAIRQPRVIGEVLSGILLGPSLLGRLAPHAERYLFPPDARPALVLIAQIGVVLYMFVVGLEFDPAGLRRRAAPFIVTALIGMALPFALGCGFAYVLFPEFSQPGVRFLAFAPFMGIAMSITAFPVLVRILTDRGLSRTDLGVAALTCAAVSDLTAWCLLGVFIGVGSPALSHVFSALPIIGAFIVGAMVPSDGRVARQLTLERTAVLRIALLPAFFALTGLRTQIALVSSPREWGICLAIVLLATAGKFGGTFVAGRLVGMPPRFAARLGALMNTRGLMELIVLNVGLDIGVISPALFTMMVIMALMTTAATGPALELIPEQRGEQEQHAERRAYAGRDANPD